MMTDKEIQEGNEQIVLYNKFCFNKNKLPFYKKNTYVTHAIGYLLISIILICLPTILTIASKDVIGGLPEKIAPINR